MSGPFRYLLFSKYNQGLWEGSSAGTSVRGSDSQGGACEYLKGPIVLAINGLFWYFHFCIGIFNYF